MARSAVDVARQRSLKARVRSSAWQTATVLGFVGLAAFALAPLLEIAHSQWVGVQRYKHGYILMGVAVWLVWRSWHGQPPRRIVPDWRYSGALIGLLVIWSLLEILFLNVPRVFLLPPLIVSCTGFVFGHEAARRLFWPSMMLYGALPVWAAMDGPLQSMTTAVVSSALSSIRVPVHIQGNFVQIPAGVFEISDDCSGLKYLMTSMILALFYGIAFFSSWPRRGILLGIAVIASVVCNWIRVFGVILVGHMSDMQHYLVVEDHIVFGWVLFVAFMTPVVWIARKLEPTERANIIAKRARPTVAWHGVLAAAAIAVILLALPGLSTFAISHVGGGIHVPALAHTETERSAMASDWLPVFPNAREEYAMVAKLDGGVEVYRATYERQDAQHRLISYGHSFVPADWRATGQRVRRVELDRVAFDVIELEGILAEKRRVVWGWYSVAGELGTGPLEIKLLELKGLLAGRRDAMAIALSSECVDALDCTDARARLAAYLKDALPQLTVK